MQPASKLKLFEIQSQILSTIEFSYFADCANATGLGGAINIGNSFVLISHCSFLRCSAHMGGCIYSTDSTLAVEFSQLSSSLCTAAPDEFNYGGNALCAASGSHLQADHIQIYKCAPTTGLCGESIIVSHSKRHYFGYLNLSECKGKSGAFISLRIPETTTDANFINVADSQEWTMIENHMVILNLRFSNFFRNVITSVFLTSLIKASRCIFIGNSEVAVVEVGIQFEDCIGTFYGNSQNITDTASYAFPSFRLIATKPPDDSPKNPFNLIFYTAFLL